MVKVKFYTHIEEDVENGETTYTDVYIDYETHKLYLRSTVAGKWLDEKEAVKVIFGNRKVSKEELKAWKQEKIKIYNDKPAKIKWVMPQDQAHEDNLWK